MPPLNTTFSDAIHQLLELGYEVYLPIGRNNELVIASGPYTELTHCLVRKVTIGQNGACLTVNISQDRRFNFDPSLKILAVCTLTKRVWLLPLEAALNRTCYINKVSCIPRSRSSLSRGSVDSRSESSGNLADGGVGVSPSTEPPILPDTDDRAFLEDAFKETRT